jgi:hypothetical protein
MTIARFEMIGENNIVCWFLLNQRQRRFARLYPSEVLEKHTGGQSSSDPVFYFTKFAINSKPISAGLATG